MTVTTAIDGGFHGVVGEGTRMYTAASVCAVAPEGVPPESGKTSKLAVVLHGASQLSTQANMKVNMLRQTR